MVENNKLEELRAAIDEIDDALHDLLIRRAEVTSAISQLKQQKDGNGALGPAIRPAREAQILRRLLARHHGRLPRRFVLRIWREIIAASLQLQTNFQLHVYSGENQQAFADLAAAYFGSLTPMKSHTRASLVVHACAEEPNSLGIVPLPQSEEAGVPWWAQLAPARQPGPRIIAKLPFIVEGDNPVAAYAIGAVEQEETGDDTTLLRLEIAPGVSRGTLGMLLRSAGFDAHPVAGGRTADRRGAIVLVAARGFVSLCDARLERLRNDETDSIAVIVPVGGFANPIVVPPPETPR
jgi:chorismate mutase-like protein